MEMEPSPGAVEEAPTAMAVEAENTEAAQGPRSPLPSGRTRMRRCPTSNNSRPQRSNSYQNGSIPKTS